MRAGWTGASLRMRGRLCIKTMKQMLRGSMWGGRFVGHPAISAWLLTWRPKWWWEREGGGNETGIKDNALINGGRRCVFINQTQGEARNARRGLSGTMNNMREFAPGYVVRGFRPKRAQVTQEAAGCDVSGKLCRPVQGVPAGPELRNVCRWQLSQARVTGQVSRMLM